MKETVIFKSLGYLYVKQGNLFASDGYSLHIGYFGQQREEGLYSLEKKENIIILSPISENLKYPDISNILQKDFDHIIRINRIELLHLARYAKILTDKRYIAMSLIFGRSLKIKVLNLDIGKMEGKIDTDKSIKQKIEIKINPKYIINALTSFNGRWVNIGFSRNKQTPIILKEICNGFQFEEGKIAIIQRVRDV